MQSWSQEKDCYINVKLSKSDNGTVQYGQWNGKQCYKYKEKQLHLSSLKNSIENLNIKMYIPYLKT